MACKLRRRHFEGFFLLLILIYLMLMVLQHLTKKTHIKYDVQSRQFLGSVRANLEENGTKANLTTQIHQCEQKPSTLKGKLKLDIQKVAPSRNHSEQHGGTVKFGGRWSPDDCIAIKKVAILVPYRNRPQQLEIFLSHMHPIFQRQKLDYRIFVIEQAGTLRFNKGAIYNIGFKATMSYDDYGCYIFHDIDLLCENDYNYYGCPASPMHMSVAIDKFNYSLPYYTIFGGIQAITKEHYIKMNGYSNRFWGWGAEDDNLYRRVIRKGFKLARPSMEIARYKMNKIHHFRSDGWNMANEALLLEVDLDQDIDGLNSSHTLDYTVAERLESLFTLISINLKN